MKQFKKIFLNSTALVLTCVMTAIGFSSWVSAVSTQVPDDQITARSKTITKEAVSQSLELYRNFNAADPELFLLTDAGIKNLSFYKVPTDTEMEYVRQKSLEITDGLSTDMEKATAVAEYLAKNICYDYDNYQSDTIHTSNLTPYDVLVNETAVCSGYAITFAAMMQMLDIPCVLAYSPDHAWNMVYCGRWICVDTTWMSSSVCRDGIKLKSDTISYSWFDFTIERANSNYNHTINGLPLEILNGTLRKFPKDTTAESYSAPENVTSVGNGAFEECASLFSVRFSDALESVGDEAFFNCPALTSVELGNSIKTIGDLAFHGCTSLSRVELGDSLMTIGDDAFFGCAALMSIDLGNSIQSVGDWAFSGCSSLSSVEFSDTLTTIGESAFTDCAKLSSLKFGDSLVSIGDGAFFRCVNLSRVEFGNSETSIGNGTFSDCTSLTSVDFGGSRVSLGNMVFCRCTGLNSLNFGDPLTYMGGLAFYGCKNLLAVYFDGDAPEFSEQALDGLLAVAYYPARNNTWTEEVMNSCGGYIEWKPSCTTHTEVILSGKDATCTTTGLTDGKKCSVCGMVTEAQKSVPLRGHEFSYGVKNGSLTGKCTCGHEVVGNTAIRKGNILTISLEHELRETYICAARYHDNGQMVEVKCADVTGTITQIELDSSDGTVKVYFLTDGFSPWLNTILVHENI